MKVFKNSVEGSEERLSVLQQRLEETTKLMLEVVESNWHKDQYGNGYINDVVRLEEAIEFVKVDREFYLDIEHPGHLFLCKQQVSTNTYKEEMASKRKGYLVPLW